MLLGLFLEDASAMPSPGADFLWNPCGVIACPRDSQRRRGDQVAGGDPDGSRWGRVGRLNTVPPLPAQGVGEGGAPPRWCASVVRPHLEPPCGFRLAESPSLDSAPIPIQIANIAIGPANCRWSDAPVTEFRYAARCVNCEGKPDHGRAQSELDWRVVRTDLSVPVEIVNGARAAIDGADSLRDAFGVLVSGEGPAGDPEKTAEDAAQVASALIRLPTMSTTQNGLPIKTWGEDTDGHQRFHVGRWQILHLRLCTAFAAVQLDAIGARFAPTNEQIVEALTYPQSGGEDLRRIARGFEHYWSGQPDRVDDAVYLVVPRCEGLLRELCHAYRVPTYTPEKGKKPGRMAMLGELLRAISGRTRMTPSWCRSLELLLAEQGIGLNLRNRVAHGELGQTSPFDLALLLRATVEIVEELRAAQHFASCGTRVGHRGRTTCTAPDRRGGGRRRAADAAGNAGRRSGRRPRGAGRATRHRSSAHGARRGCRRSRRCEPRHPRCCC